MKKCYLFLALLCMAGSLFAQQQPKVHVKDISANPTTLGPEMVKALFLEGVDANGYLPPVSVQAYNLTDSMHLDNWNDTDGDWYESQRWYYTNDCETGLRHVTLVRAINPSLGIMENVSRSEVSYFPDNTTQLSDESHWRPNLNDWFPSGRTVYIAPGKKGESWYKYWDDQNNVLSQGFREVFVYDNDLVLQTKLTYDLDVVSDTWKSYGRTNYTYTNGLETMAVEEQFDAGANAWNFVSRVTNTYNAQGNITEKLTEGFYIDDWFPQTSTIYTYNAANLLETRVDRNADGTNWKNTWKTEAFYYPSNTAKYSESFNWSETQQDWVMNFRDSSAENGNLVYLIAKYGYDEMSNSFFFGYRVQYEYDNMSLNNTSYLDELDITDNTWKKYSTTTVTFDTNDRFVESISKLWSDNLNEYVNDYRYHNFNTGCLFNQANDAAATSLACLHANPLKAGQPILCDQPTTNQPQSLTLHSMSGICLHRQDFRTGDTFQPTAKLAPGIYLLSIGDESGPVYRSKVVVME